MDQGEYVPRPTNMFPPSTNRSLLAPTPASIQESEPIKKKKGPAPKIRDGEKCVICNAPASGFHYNVLTCEGCKGFFRRSVVKKRKYVCRRDNSCNLEPLNNRKCQHCRFKKCLEQGMTNQMVGLYKNRSHIEKNKQQDMQRQHKEDHLKLAEYYEVKKEKSEKISKPTELIENKEEKKKAKKKQIDPLLKQLIYRIDKSKKQPEQTYLKEIQKLSENFIRTNYIQDSDTQKGIAPENYSEQVQVDSEYISSTKVFHQKFQHFVDLTIGAMKGYALFVASVDDCKVLEVSLLKNLIKSTVMFGMVLKACYDYNLEDNTLTTINGSRYGKKDYLSIFPEQVVNEFFDGMKIMKVLMIDKNILVMVTLLTIFNPSLTENLEEKKKLKELRYKYSDWLRRYCFSLDKPFLSAHIMLNINLVYKIEDNILEYVKMLCKTQFKTEFPVLDDLYMEWLQKK